MKYKKILILLGLIIFLGTQSAFSAFSEKNDINNILPRDKTENNTLSIEEFNTVLGTLKGIFNWQKSGKTQIGIGDKTPDKDLTLDVEGKIGAQFFCDEEGNNCIKAGDWKVGKATSKPSPLPNIIKKNIAAQCLLRYRVKIGNKVSDWNETGGNESPEGGWTVFASTEKDVCKSKKCAIQIGLKCEKSQNIEDQTTCQARYRLFDEKNIATNTGWITTPKAEKPVWRDGAWMAFSDWKNLSWQAGLQCQSEKTTCRISYKTRDEKNISDWSASNLTQDNIWSDGTRQKLKSERTRPCDGRNGCGVRLRLHCTDKDFVPKIPIYQCPQEKFGICETTCQGQLSALPTCAMTKNKDEKACATKEVKNCTPLGHLVR